MKNVRRNPKLAEKSGGRRHRVRYSPPTVLREVIRLFERRLSFAGEDVKSIRSYRETVRRLVDDDKFWDQLETVRVNVELLKVSIDEFLP